MQRKVGGMEGGIERKRGDGEERERDQFPTIRQARMKTPTLNGIGKRVLVHTADENENFIAYLENDLMISIKI